MKDKLFFYLKKKFQKITSKIEDTLAYLKSILSPQGTMGL